MIKGTVYYTNHYVNKTVTQYFAKAIDLELKNIANYDLEEDDIFITYGILRGTGKPISDSRNYIYIDHGFVNSSDRKFNENKLTEIFNLTGYFRIIKNDLYFNRSFDNVDKSRFEKLNINLKDLNKKGDKIIVSEPSEHIRKFLKLNNWTDETIREIKKYTDRDIIVHNKFSKTPLTTVLKDAFAFVSCQSTAAYKALSEGIPSYFTHESLKGFGEINHIEKRILNHDLLYLAANSQWRLNEFFSDEFKNFINRIS